MEEGEENEFLPCCGPLEFRQGFMEEQEQEDERMLVLYPPNMRASVSRILAAVRKDCRVPHREEFPDLTGGKGVAKAKVSWPETYRLVESFKLRRDSVIVFDLRMDAISADVRAGANFVTVRNMEQKAVKRMKYEVDTSVRELVKQHCTMFQINPHQRFLGLCAPNSGDGEPEWLEDDSVVVSHAQPKNRPVDFAKRLNKFLRVRK